MRGRVHTDGPQTYIRRYSAKNLDQPALRSSVALLVLLDPQAIRHIRGRAENYMITRLQPHTNVDTGAIIQVEIDLMKFDLPLRDDCYP